MKTPKTTVRRGKAARLSMPHRDRTKYTRKTKHRSDGR